MEWLQRMNDAVDLIESNLDNSLDIEQIAKTACSSPFHFQRMFHMVTGMTIAEYTRRRRLTLAAQELSMTGSVRVIDVALKYGYDSPESFSKAFRKLHGITPSEARRSGMNLKAFPRLSLQLTIKGDKEIDYRIVEKEPYTVIGRTIQLHCEEEEPSRRTFWRTCRQDGSLALLDSWGSDENLLGITMDIEGSYFTYLIAKRMPVPAVNTEAVLFSTYVVPGSTWAVFLSQGPLPDAITGLFQQIYQEWFPATGYEHTGGPEIEVYLPGDPSAEDYRCEVWIPVSKGYVPQKVR
ncbi:AraC family transcriptional regulator [Paenibacillus gansuensis]|uniref:Helix-turn-helix domain-containing protein n=1 Tax=Paenibacillus gansuensis TaxID=306542 RepID=A0ABW5PHQ7_9BACL